MDGGFLVVSLFNIPGKVSLDDISTYLKTIQNLPNSSFLPAPKSLLPLLDMKMQQLVNIASQVACAVYANSIDMLSIDEHGISLRP